MVSALFHGVTGSGDVASVGDRVEPGMRLLDLLAAYDTCVRSGRINRLIRNDKIYQ